MGNIWWIVMGLSLGLNVYLIFRLTRMLDEVDLLRRVVREYEEDGD